jgi:hypothetical protein
MLFLLWSRQSGSRRRGSIAAPLYHKPANGEAAGNPDVGKTIASESPTAYTRRAASIMGNY